MYRPIQLISPDTFLTELDWLYDAVNAHANDLSWTLGSHRLDIPRQPRRAGVAVVPYYFAADLWMLYEYARGERAMVPDLIFDIAHTLTRLLCGSAADALKKRRVQLDPDLLADRDLGVVLQAAFGRAHLAEGEWLNLDEVRALTNLTSRQLRRLNVGTRTIKGRVHCDPDDVARVLRDHIDDEPLFS